MTRTASSRRPVRGRFALAIAIIAGIGGAAVWYAVRQSQPVGTTISADALIGVSRGYQRGDSSAPVVITEFADFECPSCQQFATLQEPDVIARLVDTGIARFRFLDFPLTDLHGNTMIAHLAAACADDQGKFWAMHDRLFQGQYDWNTQATREPLRVIDSYAQAIGLEMGAYESCVASRKHLPRIEANRQAGIAAGVGGTPTISINNTLYPRTLTFDQIKHVIDSLRDLGVAGGAGVSPASATR